MEYFPGIIGLAKVHIEYFVLIFSFRHFIQKALDRGTGYWISLGQRTETNGVCTFGQFLKRGFVRNIVPGDLLTDIVARDTFIVHGYFYRARSDKG